MTFNDIKTSNQDLKLIQQIALRGKKVYREAGFNIELLDLSMDVEAAHNQYPLDLERFLTADPANFSHDLGGIHQNINRETYQLENCFVPRYAK